MPDRGDIEIRQEANGRRRPSEVVPRAGDAGSQDRMALPAEPILISERQYEVAFYIHANLSEKETALAIGLAPFTVKAHKRQLYKRNKGAVSRPSRVAVALLFERDRFRMVRTVPDIASPAPQVEYRGHPTPPVSVDARSPGPPPPASAQVAAAGGVYGSSAAGRGANP